MIDVYVVVKASIGWVVETGGGDTVGVLGTGATDVESHACRVELGTHAASFAIRYCL